MNNFLVLIHRIYKNGILKRGGADYIIDYLSFKSHNYLSIEHPLNSDDCSYIKKNGKLIKRFKLFGKSCAVWIQEFFYNFFYILISRRCNYDFILAVDPLNFLSAFAIKLFNGGKIHFHSVDYSENRFGNKTLDSIYNLIYKFTVKNADIVTYVSPIMGEKIKSLSPNFKQRVLFYLPNSPEFKKIPKVDPSKKNTSDLVFTKSFISDSEVDLLINIVGRVSEVKNNIVLNLIGNLSDTAKKKIIESKVSKNIKTYGLVPYKKNLRIISNSYIGIAWYENKISFEKYADSLKIREYAASGLPSICNNKISTAHEMEKVGAGIIANDAKEVAEGILLLMSDKHEYEQMRNSALKWAEEMDKVKIMDKLYKHIVSHEEK